MTDEELFAIVKKVDPLAVRLPQGIKAIAVAIAAAEREACAKVCEAQVEPVGNEWRWKRPEEAAEFDAQNRARLGCAAAIRMRSNHANPPA